MLDQEHRPLRDDALQYLEGRADVVSRIDSLADIVQQGRQEKFLIIGPGVAGQLEDLQQMILHVPLGVMLRRLLHVLQRQQQPAEEAVRVETFLRLLTLPAGQIVEIDVGIFALEHLLQLADRRPFDCFAGDRAFEDKVGLVFVIDGQLEVEAPARTLKQEGDYAYTR